LRELKETNPYGELDRLTGKLTAGLDEAARAAGVPHTINRVGSMWTLFFTGSPVTDYSSAKKADTAKFGRFFWAMMDRGVYLPCSQFEAAFNSVLHREAEIELTLRAAREALAAVA
jgi:glutamate-1-semialdehyde 2,1-aminomutase